MNITGRTFTQDDFDAEITLVSGSGTLSPAQVSYSSSNRIIRGVVVITLTGGSGTRQIRTRIPCKSIQGISVTKVSTGEKLTGVVVNSSAQFLTVTFSTTVAGIFVVSYLGSTYLEFTEGVVPKEKLKSGRKYNPQFTLLSGSVTISDVLSFATFPTGKPAIKTLFAYFTVDGAATIRQWIGSGYVWKNVANKVSAVDSENANVTTTFDETGPIAEIESAGRYVWVIDMFQRNIP